MAIYCGKRVACGQGGRGQQLGFALRYLHLLGVGGVALGGVGLLCLGMHLLGVGGVALGGVGLLCLGMHLRGELRAGAAGCARVASRLRCQGQFQY